MTPKETLQVNGVTIRRQPPIVGDYCRVPRSGRANWSCGYRATTCKGESTKCPRCHFQYCGHHYKGHVSTILAPPDVWMSLMRKLRENLEDAGRKRVKVPDVDAIVAEYVPEAE